MNHYFGSLVKTRNYIWLDPKCIYLFFPLKLTFKSIISPGQSNYFDIERVDIFVVYLDFYKSTGRGNWCFHPMGGGGGWRSILGSGWLCQLCHTGPATLPHGRHMHFSPHFHSINRAKLHLLFQVNLVFSSAQAYCFLRVGKVFTLSMS